MTEVILPGPASSPTPSQLRDNGQLSRLCAEQESRLGELERQQEVCNC